MNLRDHVFFLLYHGKGFTEQGIYEMSVDEMQAYANRLHKQLTEEAKVREQAARKQNVAASGARSRTRH